MKILTKILLRIVTILTLCAALFFGGRYAWNQFMKVQVEKKHAVIERQLTESVELTLYKMRYSDIVSIKKSLLLAKSYSLVKYTGVIRCGIEDISKARIDISPDAKRVFVLLPKSKILGNEILNQEVFDEHQSMFVRISTQEIFDEIDAARAEAEQDVIAEGILDEADQRARAVVKQLLGGMGFSRIDVK